MVGVSITTFWLGCVCLNKVKSANPLLWSLVTLFQVSHHVNKKTVYCIVH